MFEQAFAALTPRVRCRSLDWFRENISNVTGRPYDHGSYPHIGAPGGPCDALDNPRVRYIWLQWGSRLGKTFFGQCAAMKYAAHDPCPMMFASSLEKLARNVIDRTYRMIERCPAMRGQLLPVHRRGNGEVRLAACRIYLAWARSISTLADKDVKFGHGNEIDKWEHLQTSTEGDPLDLFRDRNKDIPTFKYVLESTPSVKGRSRVEHGLLHSTNCRLWVPCPHCGRYQVLMLGDPDTKHGIRWEKGPAGRSDKDVARDTAYYSCLNVECEEKILDEHRMWMMRRGVWVPEGCAVDEEAAVRAATATKREIWGGWSESPWIVGSPHRGGVDAGYQLSSLYALSLSWGDIASRFVEVQGKTQSLRNFVNQWKAETWEVVQSQQTWEELGERMIRPDVPLLVVPDGYSMVTMGVDKQDKFYVYVVDAWAPDGSCHTLDYGDVEDEEGLIRLFRRKYRHADGGESVPLSLALCDSGFRPKDVHALAAQCRENGVPMLVCRGSNTPLDSFYTVKKAGKASHNYGKSVVFVDTSMSQYWLSDVLMGKSVEKATVWGDSLGFHEPFLQQLLNDAPIEKIDTTNNIKEVWQRVDENFPNDLRDCKRYSKVAVLLKTRGSRIPTRRPPAEVKRAQEAGLRRSATDGGRLLERPGGWI